jgi:hypothetical protein
MPTSCTFSPSHLIDNAVVTGHIDYFPTTYHIIRFSLYLTSRYSRTIDLVLTLRVIRSTYDLHKVALFSVCSPGLSLSVNSACLNT